MVVIRPDSEVFLLYFHVLLCSLCQRYAKDVFVSFDVAENDDSCNISSKRMRNDIRPGAIE